MKRSDLEIDLYDPCPCGSGEKYKFCCAAKAKENRHGKFPIGTVAFYGPDDQTTTKIAAGVIRREGDHPILKRWVATDVTTDPKVLQEIRQFFAKHGVKTISMTEGNLGCPHEEGKDYTYGEDCPLCPFWAGKQGAALRDDDGYDDDDEELTDGEDGEEVDQATPGDAEDGDDEQPERDFDAAFARLNALLGDPEPDFDQSRAILLAHLRQHLQLPCEVRGGEDFRWEEPYVIGGWSPAEYKRLKKTQPSYTDRFELLGIVPDEYSEWMMYEGDLAARVKRVSDGKSFVLGLSELKATDKQSPNYQLLDDYAVWLANSR